MHIRTARLNLILVALAVGPAAVLARSKMDLVVVAERFGGEPTAAPSSGAPATYVAVNGGFVEAGDAVAGETPPAPEAVAEALERALASASLQPAVAPAQPALLLIYHWGVIGPLNASPRPNADIPPNFRARLSLVATSRVVDRLAERIVARRFSGMSDRFNLPPEETALQLADDRRYFVMVTAYDYAALAAGQINPVWRTRLSVPSTNASMSEAILAMLQSGAQYFGRNPPDPAFVDAPVPADHGAGPPASGAVPRVPPEATAAVPVERLRDLVAREHDLAAGLKSPRQLQLDAVAEATRR